MDGDARKIAAEERRKKLLARGRSRLDQITGEALDPKAFTSEPSKFDGSSSILAPTSETVIPTAQPAQLQASQPTPRGESSFRQKKYGATADSSWSEYEAPGLAAKSSGSKQQQPSAPLTTTELMNLGVSASSMLRLFIAVAFALLLALSWDLLPLGPPSPAQLHLHLIALGKSWSRLQKSPGMPRLQKVLAMAVRVATTKLAMIMHNSPIFSSMLKFPPVVVLMAMEAGLILAYYTWLSSGWGISGGGKHAANKIKYSKMISSQSPLASVISSVAPGFAAQMELMSAWQRMLSSLIDNIATFVMALAFYNLLPLLESL